MPNTCNNSADNDADEVHVAALKEPYCCILSLLVTPLRRQQKDYFFGKILCILQTEKAALRNNLPLSDLEPLYPGECRRLFGRLLDSGDN